MPPEAYFGGLIRFDDGPRTLPIRPRLQITGRFDSVSFEFPDDSPAIGLDVILFDKLGESLTWPSRSFAWEELGTKEIVTIASGSVSLPLPSVSPIAGEGMFASLHGAVSQESTSFGWAVEVYEETPIGPILRKSFRTSTSNGTKYIDLEGCPYPFRGGEVRIVRSSGAGNATYNVTLARSTK